VRKSQAFKQKSDGPGRAVVSELIDGLLFELAITISFEYVS